MSFSLISCGAVMPTPVKYCTALCRSMLNYILVCCQVQGMKQWHFDAIKEFLFLADGHYPSHLTLWRPKKYQFCVASLEVAPWFCCHSCTVFITSFFCCSLLPFSSSLHFGQYLLDCYHVKMGWYGFGTRLFCKLSVRQHFSSILHVKSHLIC